ncbi:MAG TPA: transglycosylase domain-containing protein, partial [Longimicrobiaceae bacterium]|nr:transglycosylase domain-containing protein [Longimicrobiaceae bacterium]
RELLRQVHQLRGDLRGHARELSMGVLLDYHLSREEVLELYLNRVYLGEHEGWPVFGIYHAAREYFDKEPQELTPGEAATLAGLLLPPRLDEPTRWPGALGARRNEVLRQMLAAGVIIPEDFEDAAREPLRLRHAAEFTPMTRPAGAQREPQVIRVAPPPPPDTLQAR